MSLRKFFTVFDLVVTRCSSTRYLLRGVFCKPAVVPDIYYGASHQTNVVDRSGRLVDGLLGKVTSHPPQCFILCLIKKAANPCKPLSALCVISGCVIEPSLITGTSYRHVQQITATYVTNESGKAAVNLKKKDVPAIHKQLKNYERMNSYGSLGRSGYGTIKSPTHRGRKLKQVKNFPLIISEWSRFTADTASPDQFFPSISGLHPSILKS